MLAVQLNKHLFVSLPHSPLASSPFRPQRTAQPEEPAKRPSLLLSLPSQHSIRHGSRRAAAATAAAASASAAPSACLISVSRRAVASSLGVSAVIVAAAVGAAAGPSGAAGEVRPAGAPAGDGARDHAASAAHAGAAEGGKQATHAGASGGGGGRTTHASATGGRASLLAAACAPLTSTSQGARCGECAAARIHSEHSCCIRRARCGARTAAAAAFSATAIQRRHATRRTNVICGQEREYAAD